MTEVVIPVKTEICLMCSYGLLRRKRLAMTKGSMCSYETANGMFLDCFVALCTPRNDGGRRKSDGGNTTLVSVYEFFCTNTTALNGFQYNACFGS
jgi:hypothetical protein